MEVRGHGVNWKTQGKKEEWEAERIISEWAQQIAWGGGCGETAFDWKYQRTV